MSEQDDVELDTSIEPTKEVDNTKDSEVDAPVAETEDVEKLKETNKRLFERAKTAENKLKEFNKKPDSTNNSVPQTVDPVEVANLANALQGLTQEEIDFAKTIAAGGKTTLLQALQTEGFKAYHKNVEAEERKKKAALGASKGSGQEVQKSMSELSREDHMKLAAEAAQNIR